MPHVCLVRGLPGSGKTTFARKQMRPGDALFEADDYFINPETGAYEFDPTKLIKAHADCENRVRQWLEANVHNAQATAYVANTFVQSVHMHPYLRMAREFWATYEVVFIGGALSIEECHARNTHGVPLSTMYAMASKWESSYTLPFE